MNDAEKRFKKQCVDYIKTVPHSIVRVNHITMYGTTGDPDLLGCIAGRAFAIELKVGTNKPTKIQEERIKAWQRAGALAGVAYTLDDVKIILGLV